MDAGKSTLLGVLTHQNRLLIHVDKKTALHITVSLELNNGRPFPSIDWVQCWYCWDYQGASRAGSCSQCARLCRGHQDRHVSTQRAPGDYEAAHESAQVSRLQEDTSDCTVRR